MDFFHTFCYTMFNTGTINDITQEVHMKKVLQIFQRDLKRLLRSPAAALVMVGVCILPSLYAWFNIAANMDPYGNTKNVKVAIANCDTGGHTGSWI